MNPYSTPSYAEREEAQRAMMLLDRQQQAVLRSYVVQVHFGSMTLTQWHDSPHGVSRNAWQKPARKGGRYYGTEEDGNPLFRAALAKLIECYAAARTEEEARAVAAAGRAYRLAAADAADRHIWLMQNAQDESVQLRAASEVADRAGVVKVGKLDVTSGGERVRTYSVVASPDDWDEGDNG